MTEARLDEILAPGVAPDEVPELAPLLQARPLLAAFSTLFHGSEAEVLMRLLVLREIGRETDAPRWGPDQLRQRFAFLDPVKLETALRWRGTGLRSHEPVTWRRRLRAVGLAPDPVSQGLGPTWRIASEAALQDGAGVRAAFLLRAEKRRSPLTPAHSRRALRWQPGTA